MSGIRRVFVTAILVLTAVACARPGSVHAEEAANQKVLITMGSFTDDLHKAMMGIKLARALQDKGAEVSLFLNLEAVPLADARRPNELLWGPAHNPFSLYFDQFVEKGGKVHVCPHCAAAVGLTAEHLRPGISILEEDKVADVFLVVDKILAY
jgi:predicted peroxiredoxin